MAVWRERSGAAYLFRRQLHRLLWLPLLLRFSLLTSLSCSYHSNKDEEIWGRCSNTHRRQYMSYYILEADERLWTHVHAHASHLPRNCVTLSLRAFFLFARRRKKVNANVDLLPLCCACLATAACLLLMSVNTFSESALGILSKRTKQLIYEQAKKTLDFSCNALKWSVIKLWLVTAELARYSLCGLNKSNTVWKNQNTMYKLRKRPVTRSNWWLRIQGLSVWPACNCFALCPAIKAIRQ